MKFSLSRFESRTIIIAVIGMLGFGYWLTRDDLFSEQNNQGIEIGKFKTVVKNVKSRTSNSFVWDSAYEELPIYQRQNIFTGPDSEAEIELESGSKLYVKPNSLIRLVAKNGGIQLDLKYGQLESQLAKTEKLIISDGETKTEVRSENKESRVALTRKKQESAKIRSLAGSVQVKSGKTEIKLSKPNDEARIKVGRVESPTVTAKLTPITADNQTFLRYRPEDPIYLQWMTTNPSVHNRMTVAEDSALTIIKKSELLKGDRYTISKDFVDRKYFWKLEAVDESQKVIAQLPIQSFSISTVATPEITSPENRATLKFGSDSTVSPIPVELKGNNYITSFHLEIASDEKFQNVLFKETTRKTSLTSTGLPSGKYFARVAGEGPNGQMTQWSPASYFEMTVLTKAKTPKDAPILVTKTLSHQLTDRAPASISPIRWKTTDDVLVKYELQISPNADFSQKTTFETKELNAVFKPKLPGQYFFRVSGKNRDGVSSPFSEVGTFNVTGYSVTLTGPPSVKYVSETSPVPPEKNFAFNWSRVPAAEKYILEVSTDKSFKQAKTYAVTSNQTNIQSDEPGPHYARVRGYNSKDQVITAHSNIVLYNYDFTTNLKPPLLLEPRDKTSMFLQSTKDPQIWLTWREIPKIQAYTVEISQTPDFKNILYTIVSPEHRLLVNRPLGQGRFYWRVRAGNQDKRLPASDWSPPFEFSVKQQSTELIYK